MMAADRVLEMIRQAAHREVELLRQAGVDIRAINLTAFVSVSQGVVSVGTTPPADEPMTESELIPVNEPTEPEPAKISPRRKPAKK